ncbi:MAG: imidazole glycerol phosphate synthase subunit HisH [Pseudomonadota bacterium]
MKIGIVNYGMGNLGSVRRALDDLGAESFIAEHPVSLIDANRIVLPGVGAFAEGIARLQQGGWIEAIRRFVQAEKRPLLGICLGMQMLATKGEEGGGTAGLDLVGGRIRRLDTFGCSLRIPHVGWNDVSYGDDQPLFAHIPQHSDFYFVHSYAFDASNAGDVAAATLYGVPVVAGIRHGNVFGTQFHPEKSSRAGRQLLRNFIEFVAC